MLTVVVVMAVVYLAAKVISRAPAFKQVLGLFGLAGITVTAVATDLVRKPGDTWLTWWGSHPLFTGVLTSLVLLGAGYVALDISQENARRAAEDNKKRHIEQLLVRLRGVLTMEHTFATINYTPVGGDALGEPVGQLRERCQGGLEWLAKHNQTVGTWTTVLALAEDASANNVSQLLLDHTKNIHQSFLAFQGVMEFEHMHDARVASGSSAAAARRNADHLREQLMQTGQDFSASLKCVMDVLPEASDADEAVPADMQVQAEASQRAVAGKWARGRATTWSPILRREHSS